MAEKTPPPRPTLFFFPTELPLDVVLRGFVLPLVTHAVVLNEEVEDFVDFVVGFFLLFLFLAAHSAAEASTRLRKASSSSNHPLLFSCVDGDVVT